MEKSDRKLDKCGVLLWFMKCEFDAGFLTTEAAEAGSLGARRTPKGWEGCHWINQPHKFRNAFVFLVDAFGMGSVVEPQR